MRTSWLLLAALGTVLLSAPGSLALDVSPAHPGVDDGTRVPRTEPLEPGPLGRQTEIYNVNTTTYYSTIQAAHDDAATLTGHVLEVQVATHAEGPQISITKGVTLRGQTGTEVVLQSGNTGGAGDARGWFLVDAAATGFSVENLGFDGNGMLVYQAFRMYASDVSFDNCTFNDIQYSTYVGNAIVANGGANLSVTGCTFTQIQRHGIFFFGPTATGGVADNNTYTGKGVGDWLDYGIEIGGGAVATCTNNTITNCRGVASSDGSTSAAIIITTYFGPGTAGVLSGNFFNACTGAIAAGFDGTDTSSITAFDNDFSNNDTYTVGNTSATVTSDCSGNWYGSSVAATVAAGISGLVDYTPWLDVGTDTDLGTPGFQGDFSTLNVDAASAQVGPLPRVQEGINLVTASTVNVVAGLYSGNLSLGSTVTLNGAQAGVSACGRVAGGIPNPAFETVLTAPSGTILNLVNGCAGSVIDGFAFDGNLVASNGIQSGSGPLDNLVIQNNWIGQTTSSGVFLNDSGIDITMHQNELDGTFHGSGGYLHLDQDNFDGFHLTDNCIINAASGTGFFVDGNHNIGASVARAPLISGNLFDGNDTGANLGKYAFENGTIVSNTFQNNLFDGLQGGIQSTIISGNSFLSNGRSGIALTGFGGTSDPTRGAQNCQISGNTFSGNVSEGLFFTSSQFPGTIATNVANNNDFVGNPVGVYHGGTEVIDVSCNWWGDLGGPDLSSNPNPPGDDISGTTFVFWPWLDGSIAGTPNCNQFGGNNVAAQVSGCISFANPCETVDMNFYRTDVTGARAISVTFQLSGNLQLCVDAATSIGQGTWLGGYGTAFQVLDNGGGSYTVDQSILGTPCGVTTGGQLFTMDLAASGGDGTGTITVTSVRVRDCANATIAGIPGPPTPIEIDTTPPGAVIDLSSTQMKTGNPVGNDTTGVFVNFTAPVDAVVVEVYGAGFGNYPEYDDAPGSGSVPATPGYPPGGPWVLTSATTTGAVVHFPTRDFYYFVMFTKDACGNVSAVSNQTSGTLNYHLGDATDGFVNGHGNNLVSTADITLLGAHYGITLVASDTLAYLDVGPTSDYSVDALPQTDNQVEFEDLLMFSINYGNLPGPAPRGLDAPSEGVYEIPALALEVASGETAPGDRLVARLTLQDNVTSVKGIHSVVAHAGLELVDVRRADLLDSQDDLVFLGTIEKDGQVTVDAAVMGTGRTVSGSGVVAELVFQVQERGAVPSLALADLRDRNNGFLLDRTRLASGEPARSDGPSISAGAAPATLELLGARPNPFGSSTAISFQLPTATRVSVVVYDVSGRLVRTLVNRTLPAGVHQAAWNGRTDDGTAVSTGVYFYTFQAGDMRETRKLLHVR